MYLYSYVLFNFAVYLPLLCVVLFVSLFLTFPVYHSVLSLPHVYFHPLALVASAVLEDTRPYLHNPPPPVHPPVPPPVPPVHPQLHASVPSPVHNPVDDDGDRDKTDDHVHDSVNDTDDVDDNGGDDNYNDGDNDADNINHDDHHGFVTADDINDNNDNDNENSMVSLPFSNGAVPSPGSNPLPPTTSSPVNSGPGLNPSPASGPSLTSAPSPSPMSMMSVLKPLSSLRLDVQGAVRVLVEFSLRKVCVTTRGSTWGYMNMNTTNTHSLPISYSPYVWYVTIQGVVQGVVTQ